MIRLRLLSQNLFHAEASQVGTNAQYHGGLSFLTLLKLLLDRKSKPVLHHLRYSRFLEVDHRVSLAS